MIISARVIVASIDHSTGFQAGRRIPAQPIVWRLADSSRVVVSDRHVRNGYSSRLVRAECANEIDSPGLVSLRVRGVVRCLAKPVAWLLVALPAQAVPVAPESKQLSSHFASNGQEVNGH